MPDSARGHRGDRPHASDDGGALLRYLRLLRERVWLILGCAAVVFAATALYVAVAPRKYTAQATMLVQAANPAATVLSTLPVLHQTGNPTEDVLTGASLVTTTRVANAVVSSLHLNISGADALGSVQASPVGQAGLVAVQAEASSPQRAQKLANGFVEQTIALSTASMHAAINAELPTLRTQLATVAPSQRYIAGSVGQQLQELEQLLHQNDPTLTLISPAALPTAPSSPKVKLTLVAGLLGGLLLGVGAAFAFHALDPRLRREEQLRDLFGVPVQAKIPREPSIAQGWRPLLPGDLSFPAQEGYRTLRTMLTSRAAGRPRTYLITGSSPGEGKTTTAINLAVSFAQGGSRVILIEADLRRPTIAGTLRLEPDWGTEHVLVGEVTLKQALTQTTFDGASLQVLAVQRPGVELADRLSYGVAQSLISSAIELAECVVIDAPPLTAVSDALPLARLADDVLVVARIGVSKLSSLSELHDLLLQQGSYPSGLVLVESSVGPAHGYYATPEPPAPRRDRDQIPETLEPQRRA
jgi:capsular exopolysaccharide synthesis family protein